MTRSSGLRSRLVAAARTPMVRAIVRCLIGCAFTASTTRVDSSDGPSHRGFRWQPEQPSTNR